MTSELWTLRPSEPSDENCLVSMWCKSHAHSREVREILPNANIDGSQDEIRHWRVHQPIVEALVHSCDVRVAVDPLRVHGTTSLPAVILGWACMSGEAVHWVAVKRSVVRAGLGDELVRDMLGDRLDRVQTTTFELVDLAKLKMIPALWTRDREWLSSLRSLSSRTLAGDKLFASVAGHVVDARRAQWQPSSITNRDPPPIGTQKQVNERVYVTNPFGVSILKESQ